MVKKWLTWINYAAMGIIVFFLLAALILVWMRTNEFPMFDVVARKSIMPKGSFSRPQEHYEAIGAPALNLTFSPLSTQLPDLRHHLIYYGKNGRPDANADNPAMYFAFTGNKSPVSLLPGQKLYIMYDKKQTPNQYVFSPKNAETPVWIEANAQGTQAIVKVRMMGDNGQIISEPAAYAEFSLPEKEFARFGSGVWELGKWRVDGTLLARQKARWYGIDVFIDKYGGEEYKDFKNKQRIDFGEDGDVYSVYVGQGDCLVWKNDRWQSIEPGENSLDSTILCVKKIDERVMNLELWDVEGKGKIILNLIKIHEAWVPKTIEDSFKFVGARTRSQLIFEIDGERILLRPHDWLLKQETGWEKIETPEAIDEYVARKLVGPLFVFDSIERKDDRSVVFGTLFNAARTEMVPIELSLQQPGGPTPPPVPDPKKAEEERMKKMKEHPMFYDMDDD